MPRTAFGPVSVLVNDAGIQNPAATLEDTDRQNWERVLAVNLTGTYLGIRAAAPSLRRAGGGAVVNIGSAMGHGGTAMFGPYVATAVSNDHHGPLRWIGSCMRKTNAPFW
ncbi:SDR family NAD(P)-dependent oxidoreductase [Nocardia sp. NPDC051321]|uniref:SDR family NAD(P)-dependent oxidoreductase n=1 Tax=Nocardia sp. NPDC051321 TaxID=3364323 RepID=UPI00379E60AE